MKNERQNRKKKERVEKRNKERRRTRDVSDEAIEYNEDIG